MKTSDSTEVIPFYIGREAIASSDEPLRIVNPSTGSVIRHIATACADDVDRAMELAFQTSCSTGWRDALPLDRAKLLRSLGDAIDADAGHLAELQSSENGKTIKQSLAQAKQSAAVFRYFAAVCETAESSVTPSRGKYLSFVEYEPYGVVAAITPWNSPLTMEAQKVAPAIAAGNCVVLKPSEVTPSCALRLAELARASGMPEGVLTVLPGYGRTTGWQLVQHRHTGMVTFTGGTETGKMLGEYCSRRLIPVVLELGGKSPQIVFADADLDLAASAVIDGIFEGSGQSCVAGSRLFVESSCYAEFVEKLVYKAGKLKIGAPDTNADLGPLATHDQLQRVISFVDSAVSDGARILCGGQQPEGPAYTGGAFYLPTILADISHDNAAVQEEIFGPVLSVFRFSSRAELVQQANGTKYGLAAGIWTRDARKALRTARDIRAGTVWINTYKQLSISTPFGGYKESGLGREKGIGGMRVYQQSKSIYVAT